VSLPYISPSSLEKATLVMGERELNAEIRLLAVSATYTLPDDESTAMPVGPDIIAPFLFQTHSNSKYKKTPESMIMAKDIMMKRKLRLSKLEAVLIPSCTEYGNLKQFFLGSVTAQ
jgi:hypothetical protein